jgi:hypothetical protein
MTALPDKAPPRYLRQFALVLWLVGAALCIIGTISILSSYAQLIESANLVGSDPTGQLPKYGWCLYTGLAPLAVGTALRMYVKIRRL